MQITTNAAERPRSRTTAIDPLTARRAAQELDEFRRYNYADGWDSDDADLGWVDEEIVSTPRRRRTLH